jgi:hypothetical protein
MFRPTQSTAEKILRFSATLPAEILWGFGLRPHQGFSLATGSSKKALKPFYAEKHFDWETATAEIGDRVMDVMGMLSRQHASYDPPGLMIVVTNQGKFSSEVEPSLLEELGLVSPQDSHPVMDALDSLARDFVAWAKSDDKERTELGLDLDDAEQVQLLFRPLDSDLP